MIPKVKKKYFALIGESKVPLGRKFANFLSFVRINFHKFVKMNKPAIFAFSRTLKLVGSKQAYCEYVMECNIFSKKHSKNYKI